MSEKTKIEWCDHTWSPWRGCTKVSPGCAHCYAEKLSKRNPAVLGEWGKGKPRVLNKDWNKPIRWNKPNRDGFTLNDPPIRVFPSLCDWLDEEVPIEWLARFLKLIHDTPNIDWLLLTKRPELFHQRMALAVECKTDGTGRDGAFWQWAVNWWAGDAPKNVVVGASAEDHPRADERIQAAIQIPARRRFLSVEPLLGPVNIGWWLSGVACPKCGGATVPRREVGFYHERRCPVHGSYDPDEKRIDWVIVGGESGPGARPCDVQWVRDIVAQCKAAGVPCFVKQLGAVAFEGRFNGKADPASFDRCERLNLKHPKGGDPAEWPEDLCVRQFPEVKP